MNKIEGVYIYALVDPREPNHVRYVGYTNWPRHRLTVHEDVGASCTHKCNWIRKITREGVRPQMRILSVHTDGKFKEYEVRAIAWHKAQGHKLTNSTLGGDGPNVTEEFRELARQRLAIHQDSMQTPERRAMRAAKLAAWRASSDGQKYLKSGIHRGRKKPRAKSKYVGVSRHQGKWWARIYLSNKQAISLGVHSLEEDAAKAVQEYYAKQAAV